MNIYIYMGLFYDFFFWWELGEERKEIGGFC